MDTSKIVAAWNSFMANPVKFVKFLIFSLDHSDRGASIKKLLAWVICGCIAFLHWCLYKFKFAAAVPDFTLFTTVLMFDGGLLAALIGVNFLQETHAKNLDAGVNGTQGVQ